jgi:hypothetical protein
MAAKNGRSFARGEPAELTVSSSPRPVQRPNQRAKDRTAPRQFSTLIKSMVVELDRDPALHADGNIVEVRSAA